jgi:hypothetical protein
MASYSGLWNGIYGTPYTPLGGNNTKEFNNSTKKQLSKLIGRRRGPRVLMQVMRTLNGAAPGATAALYTRRVSADVNVNSPMVGGGKRGIEDYKMIDRVTTAADQTMIQAIFDQVFRPNPYPFDKSTNGGGNKRNAI